MYYTNFGDLKTAYGRIGFFYEKHYRVPAIIRKIVYTVLIVALAVLALTAVAGKMTDNAIKARQLNNLVVYHDINGFKPLH
jgi:hypothetical protein